MGADRPTPTATWRTSLALDGAERLRAALPLATALRFEQDQLPGVGVFRTADWGRISELLTASAVTSAPAPDDSYELVVLVTRQARPARDYRQRAHPVVRPDAERLHR